jgi:reverse gyrase
MKTIILKIDDDVLGSLRSNINVKMMGGNFAGITDQFIKKLIDEIDDNNKEWHCQYKNKIKKSEKKA